MGWYSVFGFLQVSGRIIGGIVEVVRTRMLWRSVPRANYPDGFFGFLPHQLKNRWRVHQYRAEISSGLPVCKVFGMAIQSGSRSLTVQDPECVKHFLKDSFEKYTKNDPARDPLWHYFSE